LSLKTATKSLLAIRSVSSRTRIIRQLLLLFGPGRSQEEQEKFKGLEGTARQVVNVDPKPGGTIGSNQISLEYASEQQGKSGGTAQEARAMLDKAVATVNADRDMALGMFNKGEGGFKDRGPLSVLCKN
jgi:hypothetical protein